MSLTASIRYIILFSKVELALRTSTKFENDSSSYRKLEDCTLHIVHVLHTLHICDATLNTALHTATVVILLVAARLPQ